MAQICVVRCNGETTGYFSGAMPIRKFDRGVRVSGNENSVRMIAIDPIPVQTCLASDNAGETNGSRRVEVTRGRRTTHFSSASRVV